MIKANKRILASRKGVTVPAKGTTKIGRDAGTGRFIPVRKAEQNRKTAVVETIKKGGKK